MIERKLVTEIWSFCITLPSNMTEIWVWWLHNGPTRDDEGWRGT